jgi:GNAT superfamily N-acetyltransferase
LYTTGRELDTFVRKSFRKKGIGKALVNSLVKPQDNPRVFRGIKGSDIFYRKSFRKENGTHVM